MGGVTNDRLRAKQPAGLFWRQVVLTQVNAIRTAIQSDVDSIINDHGHGVLPGQGDRFDGLSAKLPRCKPLVTKLNKAGPPSDKSFDLGAVREARKPNICNRINSRRSEFQISKRAP